MLAACTALLTVGAFTLRLGIGLPTTFIVGVLLAIVLATAMVLWRRSAGAGVIAEASSPRGVVTAVVVGILGLSAAGGGFAVLRAMGVGPFATLITAGALSARDPIVVAEIRNTTPDSTLGLALTEALTIDLTQSKVIRILSANEVRDAIARMKRPPATRVTEDVALELAARAKARRSWSLAKSFPSRTVIHCLRNCWMWTARRSLPRASRRTQPQSYSRRLRWFPVRCGRPW